MKGNQTNEVITDKNIKSNNKQFNSNKQIEEIKALNLLLKDITVDAVLFNSDGEVIDVIAVPAVDLRATNQLANILYNAGYRKERQGEWITDKYTEAIYCSVCNGLAPVDCEKERFFKSDYCPDCGARMKGE